MLFSHLVFRIFRNCKISENCINLRALKNLKPGRHRERRSINNTINNGSQAMVHVPTVVLWLPLVVSELKWCDVEIGTNGDKSVAGPLRHHASLSRWQDRAPQCGPHSSDRQSSRLVSQTGGSAPSYPSWTDPSTRTRQNCSTLALLPLVHVDSASLCNRSGKDLRTTSSSSESLSPPGEKLCCVSFCTWAASEESWLTPRWKPTKACCFSSDWNIRTRAVSLVLRSWGIWWQTQRLRSWNL